MVKIELNLYVGVFQEGINIKLDLKRPLRSRVVITLSYLSPQYLLTITRHDLCPAHCAINFSRPVTAPAQRGVLLFVKLLLVLYRQG